MVELCNALVYSHNFLLHGNETSCCSSITTQCSIIQVGFPSIMKNICCVMKKVKYLLCHEKSAVCMLLGSDFLLIDSFFGNMAA